MADGNRSSIGCTCWFCLVAAALLLLIGVSVYLMRDRSATVRGSVGPLLQNSPNTDPPSKVMVPQKP